MTQDEIKKVLVTRLTPKVYNELGWEDVMTVMQSVSPARQGLVLELFMSHRSRELGEMFIVSMKKLAEYKASVEADAILADNALNLKELERIL